ncbi:uncharacterized protein MYCFIDRAFT_205715 [Pseudocercospora fijiensis CIRAD86]|uniref:Uncharacterized protein n=1 Tax=Pseudocercospora fijiensis (strain CIRAD86) TaxID=383855 RepID=N1Q7F7_PSEFD|nr:uncharacterized protein MYCFIDRAFT_205715 [Pseudocercospora fijiensis CIRAD86]EME87551.1 hypothetical protein MYCFIDRAFT_205715 [Pseudocercospora fijiensis CIRAD86]
MGLLGCLELYDRFAKKCSGARPVRAGRNVNRRAPQYREPGKLEAFNHPKLAGQLLSAAVGARKVMHERKSVDGGSGQASNTFINLARPGVWQTELGRHDTLTLIIHRPAAKPQHVHRCLTPALALHKASCLANNKGRPE